MLNQFVTERIGRIRAAGGDVSDLRQGPEVVMQPGGGVFGGFQLSQPGVEVIGPAPTALSQLRGGANVFGNQLDAITSAVIGATLGRFLPR